jgi:soluble cytochrome b562
VAAREPAAKLVEYRQGPGAGGPPGTGFQFKEAWYMRKLGIVWCLAVNTAWFAALPAAVQDDEQVPEIVRHMRQVNQNLRALRGQVAEPDRIEQNLQMVADVRKHLQAAQKLEPLKTPELPPAERESFLKDFRAMLDRVFETVDALESAIRNGDAAAARERLLELNELKNQGHERFKKPE